MSDSDLGKDLKIHSCKTTMFKMWQRVVEGHSDARSFNGDMALELRDNLFSDENKFWSEYEKWADENKY